MGIIFSKDRAMQLDCTLRSFFKHCKDPDEVRLAILYKTSTPADEDQYRTLKRKYGTVVFLAEDDFKANLLSLLRGRSSILFLVDDNIFVSEFFVKDIKECLHRHPDALGFSLRLGKNTTYCYMADKYQSLPSFLPIEKSVLKYVWTTAELDFAYPLELSSSFYRVADILPFFERVDFKNPNTLESAMDTNKSSFAQTKSSLLCFERSVAFCNPINMVQTMWTNRAGKGARYSAEKLSELFSQGYRIEAVRFTGFIPRSCHQEADFEFTQERASSALSPKASCKTSPW